MYYIIIIVIIIYNINIITCQSCVNITSDSICYEITGNTAFSSTCNKDLDLALSTDSMYLSILSEQCRIAVLKYRCASVFRDCTSPASLPCLSVCNDISTSCSSATDQAYIGALSAATSDPLNNCAACTNEGGSGLVRTLNTPSRPKWPRCEAYTNDICSTVISNNVYLQSNVLQIEVELQLKTILSSISYLPHNYKSPQSSCRNQFMKVMCASMLPSCDTNVMNNAIGQPLPIPFPRQVCHSQCIQLENKCGTIVYNQLINNGLNCSAKTEPTKQCNNNIVVPSVPYFPNSNTIFGVINPAPPGYTGIMQTTCENVNNTRSNDNIDQSVKCAFPLVVPADPLNVDDERRVGSCALKCGDIISSKHNRDNRKVIHLTILIIALFVTGFSLLTHLVFPITRKKMVIDYSIWGFLLCCSQIIIYLPLAPSRPGIPQSDTVLSTQCLNNAQPISRDQGGAVCIFQASLLHYCLLAYCFMWAVNAVQLALSVSKLKKHSPKGNSKSSKRLRIINVLLPIFFVSYGLIGDKYEGVEALLQFCSSQNTFYLDYIYFAPMHLAFGVGIVSMIIVTFVATKAALAVRGRLLNARHRCMKVFSSYFRIYIWITFLTLLWSVVLHFHIVSIRKRDLQIEYLEDYVNCIVTRETVNSDLVCVQKTVYDPILIELTHASFALTCFVASAIQYRVKYFKLWFYFLATGNRKRDNTTGGFSKTNKSTSIVPSTSVSSSRNKKMIRKITPDIPKPIIEMGVIEETSNYRIIISPNTQSDDNSKFHDVDSSTVSTTSLANTNSESNSNNKCMSSVQESVMISNGG